MVIGILSQIAAAATLLEEKFKITWSTVRTELFGIMRRIVVEDSLHTEEYLELTEGILAHSMLLLQSSDRCG